jgi:serine/threonine protein kinase
LLGKTSDAQADGMERHLARCAACRAKLSDLFTDDPLVEDLRSQAGLRRPINPMIDGLIVQLHQLQPTAAGSSENTSWATAATPRPAESPPAELLTDEPYDFLAPAQAPDELGRLGGYRVLKVLGAGGMGVVFQAEDAQLRRLVALKAMKPALGGSASRQRFLREARATAALCNDHIVAIHQVGEERGVPYLAMPLLQGEMLDDLVKREGKLAIPEVLRIGREIAEGLAAAHERGLIHRDIKPSNIWLESPHARVKILDFGLARGPGDAHLTQTGAILGTPAYMAPEQARGETVDHRGDIFSLGCVLYRLCVGEPPFKGKDATSVLLALVTIQPKPPRQVNPTVPAALDALIMRLLAKDLGDRPQSARAVIEAIASLEREQLIPPDTTPPLAIPVACEPASVMQVNQVVHRRRHLFCLWPSLFFAAVGALLVFVLLYANQDRRSENRPENPTKTAQEPSGELRRFRKHSTPVLHLAFVPDGSRFYSAGDAELLLWDVNQAQELKNFGTLQGYLDGSLAAFGLSPDGRRVFVASGRPANNEGGNRLRLYDQEFLQVELELAGHFNAIGEVSISPDGRMILIAEKAGTAYLWDLKTNKELQRFEGSLARFSRDGKSIVTGKGLFLKKWQVGAERELQSIELPKDNFDSVTCLAPLPDGCKIIVGSAVSGLRVWDLAEGKQLHAFGNEHKGVHALTVSADGQRLLTGGTDRTVRLWDVASWTQIACFRGHDGPVRCVAFSPRDNTALSGSDDQTVRLWQLPR